MVLARAGGVGDLVNIAAALAKQEVVTPYIQLAASHVEKIDQFTVDLRYDRKAMYSPSSYAYDQDRLLYFKLHPDLFTQVKYEKFDYVSRMSVTMGSAYHALIQKSLVDLGICSEEHIEVPVRDDKLKIKGSIDVILPDTAVGRALVDIKTMSPYAFKSATEPYDSWVKQVSVYAHLAGFDTAYIVGAEMSNPWRLKEFKIDVDHGFVSSLLERLRRVGGAVEKSEPPALCRTEKNFPCAPGTDLFTNCPAQQVCVKRWPY